MGWLRRAPVNLGMGSRPPREGDAWGCAGEGEKKKKFVFRQMGVLGV